MCRAIVSNRPGSRGCPARALLGQPDHRWIVVGHGGPSLELWNCFFYDVGPSWTEIQRPGLERFGDVAAWLSGNDRRPGQPLLIDPAGRADPRIDAFFASQRMTARAEATNRKYAQAIRVWLNFLLARGVCWDQARVADVEAFKFWRRTDDRNPLRVQGSTFGGDVAALCALYDWTAHRFGVANPRRPCRRPTRSHPRRPTRHARQHRRPLGDLRTSGLDRLPRRPSRRAEQEEQCARKWGYATPRDNALSWSPYQEATTTTTSHPAARAAQRSAVPHGNDRRQDRRTKLPARILRVDVAAVQPQVLGRDRWAAG